MTFTAPELKRFKGFQKRIMAFFLLIDRRVIHPRQQLFLIPEMQLAKLLKLMYQLTSMLTTFMNIFNTIVNMLNTFTGFIKIYIDQVNNRIKLIVPF